jgi:alpha-beta hydrolase superfamily lysophospholipase
MSTLFSVRAKNHGMDSLRRRAYLGLELVLAPEAGRDAGLMRVEHVDDAGPAARAGVQLGDRIVSVADAPLTTLDEARRVVAALPYAQPAPLELLRDGLPMRLTCQPEALALESLPSGRIELDEVAWRQHRLRALWSWPARQPPYPLIWLLPGATWLSDEHPTTPAHPMRKLVAQLTAAGFATLRVERSGLGDSEGPACTELDLQAELEGFRAAFARIDDNPLLIPERIYVFGRSLGGMLAPLVVAGRAVRGLGIWGSSSGRWSEVMLRTSTRQWALSGVTPERLAAKRAALQALHALVYSEGLSPEQAYARRPELQRVLPQAYAGRHVYGRVASYFQQLQALDLEQAFRTLEMPLLALHGSCDWLSERDDLARIAELRGRHGTLIELPGIDHHMHLRDSLEQAFATPWGGEWSPSVGAALLAFWAA